MREHKKRFFRTYIINRSFQFKFIAFALLNSVVLTIIYFFAAFFFVQNFRTHISLVGFDQHAALSELISAQTDFYFRVMLWSFLIVGVVTICLGVWFSHRIAGPLYRLRMSFQQMASEKKLGFIYFRKKDFFQEIATEFNGVVKNINEELKAETK